jgi:hypothetical protein
VTTHPVETYLKNLHEIYLTGGGTAEESYYGVLENLLNEIGNDLKPRVRCVPQLKSTGAGEPDFGFYTSDQFQSATDERPVEGALPSRGVIEVKPWTDDPFATADSEQVFRYWQRYNLVLVTNYRDFVLVGRDPAGKAVRLESLRLVESEAAFHAALAHPRKTAEQQGNRMVEFLQRVMLHAAPLTDPEDLAWFLASYAREARARVEAAADFPGLALLRKGLEETLGMKFEGDKGEHFFRATLVQTIFYGIFSSWVIWARDQGGHAGGPFDWHSAAWNLNVPMIAGLFEQIATPQRLKPLGVDEVLDWAAMALNRVDRAAFFCRFEQEHAVQYFYEPFLKAYDPDLRKELGVWFTPPEIVRYQVERVDRVLREELGLADGLADEQVVVLDPCCGTGAYLVETLRKIHETLETKGSGALVAQKVKRAAMMRVFGFEIIPAPFVVSHLQLGLLLRQIGAPLSDKHNERAGVYLTNALTNWEPPTGPKRQLEFPEFQAERDAADRVKSDTPILVILGNPPYNAFAGVSPEEEGGLVDPYKEGLTTPVERGGWGIKKFNLDDLYVRFFRIAERRIVKTGKGIVTYISNYSWTSEPSFVVLRKRLLESFDKLWIENMHGNRKISEYAPDGRTSETIFAIPGFSPGIQQGVVVSLWVRRGDHKDRPGKFAKVLYRDDINPARAVERREQLLASLRARNFDRRYQSARPDKTNRFSFRPERRIGDYLRWPKVTDLCAVPPHNGLMEKRGGALIDFDRQALEKRMKTYFNPRLDWEEYKTIQSALTERQASFDPKQTRRKALAGEKYDPGRVVRYALRPYETRWCYYTNLNPIWNRPRPALWAQLWQGNEFLLTRFRAAKSPEGSPFFFTRFLCDDHLLAPDCVAIPRQIKNGSRLQRKELATLLDLFGEAMEEDLSIANLSGPVRDYLKSLRVGDPDTDADTTGLTWMHALAVGYGPAYLAENADGIRQDWPRIPLPKSKKLLEKSAALGRRIAALLDTEKPVEGVTCGKVPPELRAIAPFARIGGGHIDLHAGDLDLTVGWGHIGKDDVCMPGKGKVEVRSTKDEKQRKLFGEKTLDIHLNNVACWANIPEPVWNFYIGGYQVIKKWLSYREKSILGRGLRLEEAEYLTEMARRLASLVLLQPELDANYEAVKSDTWHWPS